MAIDGWTKEQLGDYLRKLRESANMTHDQLGALVGKGRSQLISYEKGEVEPGATVLVRILFAVSKSLPDPPSGAPAPLSEEVIRMAAFMDDLGLLLLEVLHRIESRIVRLEQGAGIDPGEDLEEAYRRAHELFDEPVRQRVRHPRGPVDSDDEPVGKEEPMPLVGQPSPRGSAARAEQEEHRRDRVRP